MTEPIAFLNGEWLPQSRAGLSLYDAGFVLGVTIVDFLRTFNHRLAELPRHLARFQANVAEAGIEGWTHSDRDLTDLADEIVRRNSAHMPAHRELALIVFATPGPLGAYRGEPESNGPPTLGMHTFPLNFERYRSLIRDGARLQTPKTIVTPTSPWVPSTIKHRSRMHWWFAEKELVGGAAKSLLLDAAGRVTETSFANLVIVNGNVVTSPRRETILPGISLAILEELCRDVDLSFRESDVRLEDCFAADEILLCGTAFCLARVAQINEVMRSASEKTLRKLSDAWAGRLGLDFRKQILGE